MHRTLTTLTLVLLAACGSSAAATEIGHPGPQPAISVKEAMSVWYAENGTDIDTIAADMGAAADAADVAQTTGDLSQLTDACQALSDDANAALTSDPIPDPETDRLWRSALDHLGTGADLCVTGTTTYDTDLIGEATAEISAGSDDLNAATDRVDSL